MTYTSDKPGPGQPYKDRFVSSYDDLRARALDQVIEENRAAYNKRQNMMVVNSRVKEIFDKAQARGRAILNTDPQAYLDRKMLAFGLDDKQSKFPQYDYIDNKNSINSEKFEETYPPTFLPFLANAWEYDVNIQKAYELKANLITANGGEGITFTMKAHTYKEVKDESELDSILNGFISQQNRERLFDYIDNVLSYTRLYTCMEDPVLQKLIYGRGGALVRKVNKTALDGNSLLGKLGFIEGTPVAINPLSTLAMGRVLVDPVSWRVTDLWYDDAIFGNDKDGQEIPADWIPASDLIYLVNKNYHMLPNRLHYGFSEIVSTLPLSETVRQIYSEILTEANINLVLPSLMFTFDGLDQATMQQYVDNYRGGGIMGRNSNVGMDKVEFSPNLDQIIKEIEYLEKTLNYGAGVPPLFTKNMDMTNRSIADRIAEVWTITDLIPLQQKFSVELYDQFFTPLIQHWLTNEVGEEEGKNFIAAKIRVITNFPKLSFEDIKLKAETLDIYKRNFVISQAEWRKMINLEPFPEDQIKVFDTLQKRLAENPDLAEQILTIINTADKVQTEAERQAAAETTQEDAQLAKENNKMDSQNRNLVRKVATNRF